MSMTAERETLYAEYAEKVRGYVFGKLSNKADVEDVVSEVFLKVCEKYQTFDADRASAATWVYTITRNTVIDYFRAHRICAELPEDLPPREDFFAVVRAGFGQRRKTMLNSLSAGLRWEKDATRALLTAAGIAENARAEQVTLEQWKALTRAYFSMKKSR